MEDPRDIDPDLENTRPLAIVAPRRIPETDLAVYPLGLGAATFRETVDDVQTLAVLDRYRDQGGNFLVTADRFSDGHSEDLIGQWLKSRSARADMVLSTAVGRQPEHPGLSSVSIVRAVEASLRRLQTDHLDLLYLDGDDRSAPLADSLSTVEWLIETGKVRYLGACDFSAERLIEARILSASGVPKILALQTRFDLTRRGDFESALRIVAAAQDLAVLPYGTPSTGVVRFPAPQSAAGSVGGLLDRATGGRARWAGELLHRRGHRAATTLARIAGEHSVSSVSIAIAWLLAKRNVAAPIANPTTRRQVDAVMAGASIRLSRAQMLELDEVS